MTSSEASALPRLLYVGDGAVEPTQGGPVLLYRLLKDYPADKLCIAQTRPTRVIPEHRLPGVAYVQFALEGERWLNTRVSALAHSWSMLRASNSAKQLSQLANDFGPEAILTVPDGYAWLAAARFAEELELPLHLIVHDHWPNMMPVLGPLKEWKDREFGNLYRSAASRLCISPFMEEEYRSRYAVPGQVLYPSWDGGHAAFLTRTPYTYSKETGPLIAAFVGSLYFNYPPLISRLAAALDEHGGQLLLFGTHDRRDLERWGMIRPNILAQGFVTSQELIPRLQNDADFLFLPMSFQEDPCDSNMRFSFPSKVADYTVTGLPLLIWGPDYCSAVRWAQRYAPVAEVVTSESLDELHAALARLRQREHRERLGVAARKLGAQIFSRRQCVDILNSALLSATHSSSFALS
jgi:hypothetical protein